MNKSEAAKWDVGTMKKSKWNWQRENTETKEFDRKGLPNTYMITHVDDNSYTINRRFTLHKGSDKIRKTYMPEV